MSLGFMVVSRQAMNFGDQHSLATSLRRLSSNLLLMRKLLHFLARFIFQLPSKRSTCQSLKTLGLKKSQGIVSKPLM